MTFINKCSSTVVVTWKHDSKPMAVKHSQMHINYIPEALFPLPDFPLESSELISTLKAPLELAIDDEVANMWTKYQLF